MGKFLSFIGLEDVDEDEILEEEQPKPAAASRTKHREPKQAGDSAPTPQSMAGMKMIVYHPVAYDDAQSIADNLKNHKPVIVNMEELDGGCAQRVLDFLLGAVYALDGTISKISRGIFLVAPRDCDVVDNGDDYTDL